MSDTNQKHTGTEKLVKKYQKAFRIPENLDYYSDQDLKNAERKYVKHALNKGVTDPGEQDDIIPE